MFTMFIYTYFDITLCCNQDLLKYIFALQLNNFLLVCVYSRMLFA
jgi:hypothetical protein